MPLTQAFLDAAEIEAQVCITAGIPWRMRHETDAERLANLLRGGVLTPAEFDAARQRLLTRDAAASVPAHPTPTPDAAPWSPATTS